MNDSQLPAEISPKHSRTQEEGDETEKSEVEGDEWGKDSGERQEDG